MPVVQSKARFAEIGAVVGASVAGLLLVGCSSSGLSPNETPMHNYSLMMYSDQLNAPADSGAASTPAASPLRGPITVAVAQVGEIAPPQSMLDALRARPDLFRQVVPISAAASAQPLVYHPDYAWRDRVGQVGPGVYGPAAPVPQPLEPQDAAALQMAQMRHMARELGADYLLVFGGDIEHGHTQTGLSIFDLTIAGAFLVPSNAVQVTGKAAGSLIDLRTAQPVMNFSSEAKGNGMAPTAFADNVETGSMLASRDELVKKLTSDVVVQMAAQIKGGGASAPAAANAATRG